MEYRDRLKDGVLDMPLPVADLHALLQAIAQDEDVRVLLLRTAGDAAIDARTAQGLRQLPQPVIAAIPPASSSAGALLDACDIVASDEDEIQALARDFVAKDPLALRFTKETLNRVPDIGWDEVVGFTAEKFAELKALQAGRPSARAAAVESFLAGKSKPGLGA